tara:strand:+ start:212 stop:373 length:162 start_codon:yes stop_codon:yes gene_type:complete
MIEKEVILIILGGLTFGFFLWRQDKKKKEQELSDRLHIAENNITYLKNRLHKK